MTIIDIRDTGHYLFEVCPSLFPEGELTGTESVLWELYYKDKLARTGK